MTFLDRLLIVVLNAYLLAGIPIAFILLAGKASPMYRVDRAHLVRWWSWMALVVVAAAVVVYQLLPALLGSGE